jgi:hypothetical protein
MAKRFGRNQKRKMREALAESSRREAGLRNDLQMVSALNQSKTEELDRAKRIAGRMSILFPAQEFHAGKDSMPTEFRIPTFSASLSAHGSMHTIDAKTALEYCSLDVILMQVDCDVLTRAKHIRLHYKGHEVRYALSPEAAEILFSSTDLLPCVASELGYCLATTVNPHIYNEQSL